MLLATVHADLACPLGPVSALLYGHFIEHLGRITYDGLWAEQLYGRKFESPMVSRLRHEMALPWRPFIDDTTEGVRYPRGALLIGRYASPHERAHHAQAVVVPETTTGERGIAQDDVRVDAGVGYRFRARPRRLGRSGPLRVALRDQAGDILAEAMLAIDEVKTTRFGGVPPLRQLWMDDQSWSMVSCELVAARSDERGALTLTFESPPGAETTWWFDWVSLMPTDAVDGWHAAVLDALCDLRPRLLKWPGGCMADGYDWRLGIGDRDGRYGAVDQAWAAWDENDVGTDEFLQLCARTGAEPVLGINGGTGTPELAAAWVEYCNGDIAIEWGAQRARNGHPEPYRVRTWVVGNEQWGWFALGSGSAADYARRFRAIAGAMRAVDPTITVAAVGQAGAWNREVLALAGDEIDLLQIHCYTNEEDREAPLARRVASAGHFGQVLTEVGDDIRAVGTDHVRVCLDEWGWSGDGHAGALFTAAVLNALHRAAPLVAMAARAALVNVDGVLGRDGNVVASAPSFDVFQLYGRAHLPVAAPVEVEGAALDVSCLTDPASGQWTLFAVNAEPQPVALTHDLPGVTKTTTVVSAAGVDGLDGALPPESLTVVQGVTR